MFKKMMVFLMVWTLLFSDLSADLWSAMGNCISAAELSKDGDITADGVVNIGDVSKLYGHVRGTTPLKGEEAVTRLDVTGDGRVNIGDVALLYFRVRNNAVNDAMQTYAKKVQQAQSNATLTITLMSDVHYCSHQGTAQLEKLKTAEQMARLSQYTTVDLAVNLGDMVAGNETMDKTLEDLEQLMIHTRENTKTPVFFVRGNHDDNGWYSREEDGYPGGSTPEEILDPAQWQQLVRGADRQTVVTDASNPNGGYGYFDHEASKIRVFLLNTSDIPYILEKDGTYRYNAYECNAFSNAQLNFVANALQFADKENPEDWAAMFISHVPLDSNVADGYRFGLSNLPIRGYVQMLSIIDAYRKGISYSFQGSVNAANTDKQTGELLEQPEDFEVSLEVDYTSKGCGDVIAFISGHTHIDNASQAVGYPYGLSHGYTYLSVAGAESFATMVVDREKETVSVFKYGEARGPSQSKDTQINRNGTIVVANGEKEFGIDFAKAKQWVIPFEQFSPPEGNLLEGPDAVALDGYTLKAHPTPLYLDSETMLPDEVVLKKGYAISKPVLLKQNTQYVIPDIGKSTIYAFHHTLLKRSGVVRPVAVNGEQIITGGSYSGCYVVFVFDKKSYPDYENFYIKEWVN